MGFLHHLSYFCFFLITSTKQIAAENLNPIDQHLDLNYQKNLDYNNQNIISKEEYVDGKALNEKILMLNVAKDNDMIRWRDLWFVRLFFNLIGYSSVIIPCFIVVSYLKRSNYLDRAGLGCWTKLLRLFSEGSNHLTIEELNSNKLLQQQAANSEGGGLLKGDGLLKRAVRLCFLTVGLLTSYLVWGILQERIMTYDYRFNEEDSTGERFKNSQFLVFANRILAFLLALVCIYSSHQPTHRAPAFKYLPCSFSNIMSSWCQYEALKFVSFPVQVLAKTSKIIPVMLMGKLISKRSYSYLEYVTAAIISIGLFIFLLTSGDNMKSRDKVTTIAGVLILVCYLAFDSFTSNWQDGLFSAYKMSSLQMMAGVNLFSVLLTTVSLFEQGVFMEGITFAMKYPEFGLHIIILSLTSALGQLFIYATIARFGPATFTIIMTVRQALAILLSCIIYGHQVTVAGGLGIGLVFASIFVRIYRNQRKARLVCQNNNNNTNINKSSQQKKGTFILSGNVHKKSSDIVITGMDEA